MIHCPWKLVTWVFLSMFPSPPSFLGPIAVCLLTHLLILFIFFTACPKLSFESWIFGSRDHHRTSASFCTISIASLGIPSEYNHTRGLRALKQRSFRGLCLETVFRGTKSISMVIRSTSKPPRNRMLAFETPSKQNGGHIFGFVL